MVISGTQKARTWDKSGSGWRAASSTTTSDFGIIRPQRELVEITPREPLRLLRFLGCRFPAPLHVHTEYELTLILEGFGTRIVGDHIVPFGPGDFVLVGPNLPHCWSSTDESAGGAPTRARSLVVQFNENMLGEGWIQVAAMHPIQRLLKAASRGVMFHKSPHDVHQLFDELDNTRPAAALLRLGLILELLCHVERSPLASVRYLANSTRDDPNDLDRVLQYLASNFLHAVTIEDACRALGMSPSTLGRLLRKGTGRTYTETLNKLRIAKACEFLAHTERSISEVSYASGYCNLSHFNRQFARIMKMTPRAYRRQLDSASKFARSV